MKNKFYFNRTAGWVILFISLWVGNAGAAEDPVPEWINYKHQGDICLRAGQAEQAVAAYHESLALKPESTETLFNLAIAYYSQREISKAAGVLETLLAYNGQDTEARYNLACLLVYLGDKEGAFRNFEIAKAGAGCNPLLCEYIEQGLEFLRELENLTPSTQDLILFLLAQGLPAL